MANSFYYKGRDRNGNIVTGQLLANNFTEVVNQLKNWSIIPINIVPNQKAFFKPPKFLTFKQKIEPHHLMNFCRQLALLSEAGISITKSINRLAFSNTSEQFKSILEEVANDIASGLSLSEALKKHPQVFSPLIINIINIGENTGKLGEVLNYLAKYIEASITNRRRIISAMRYPMMVLLSTVAAMLVMNFLVVPKFAKIFAKFNLELPFITQAIIAASNFLVSNKLIFLFLFLTLWIGTYFLLKLPKVHLFWDKYKLKIPILGKIQSQILLSQFIWTFSLILRAGIPLLKGIELASSSSFNSYYSMQLLKISNAIKQGKSLTLAAISSGLFTPITIQMIEVGEESERLDETLAKIADHYDADIDYNLKRINELIEPILLLFIGVMVLILALGIYFPLWDLIQVANI